MFPSCSILICNTIQKVFPSELVMITAAFE